MRSFPGRGPLPERVDIIIIGGGINGMALARECAQARKSVLLVERHDFACGTSSRGTRLVDGGVHSVDRSSFRMIRESLRGRSALLREQPHLVQPLDFVLAAGSDSPTSGLQIRAALWLYRKFGKLSPAKSSTDLESLRRSLAPSQRWTLYPYQNAQCEFPERLVADWLRDACAAGAIARNYANVLAIRAAEGRVRGVLLRDALTGQDSYIESEWVINATGPWVDLVRDLTGLPAPAAPLARGVRSSHLMLRPWPGSPTVGIQAGIHSRPSPGLRLGLRPEPDRSQSITIAPWNGMLQVGSTNVCHSGDPSLATPSLEELEFLLTSAATLFPGAHLSSAAVAFSYAGVRPFAASAGETLTGAPKDFTACHHVLHNHADEGALGLLSIFGGNLATAYALAQSTAHTMGLQLERVPEPEPAFGESSVVESTLQAWASAVHASTGIPRESAEAVARWHGRHALCIIQTALHDPILHLPIVEGRPQLVAQAVEAVAYERAVTLADILLRRVPIALDQSWNEDSTVQAAARIAPALYWNERRMKDEIQAFEEERSRFLYKPKNLKPTGVAA